MSNANTHCKGCDRLLNYSRPVVIIVEVEGTHQGAKSYGHAEQVYDALDADQADITAYHRKCWAKVRT